MPGKDTMASILNERYEVIDRLSVAEGEYTRLAYKARVVQKPSTGAEPRIVLLKLLPVNADTAAVRAASERVAALPPTPNILTFYGLSEISGEADIQDGVYLVSEYTRGISLRERIRRVAPFSLAVSLEIAISICQAVIRADSFGVSHCSLKPESVLLTPEGLVKVGDFQIAEAIEAAIGGTSNCRDDRRAIGLLLYEMLTGVAADQLAIADENSPRQLNSNVPPALDGIVRKATSLDREKQYADIGRLLADLQSAREDLRAGKSLAWSPLGGSPGTAAPKAMPRAPGTLTMASAKAAMDETQSMNTGRRERNTEVDDEEGYPIWGKVLLGVLGVIVIGVIFAGAYLFTIFSVPSDVVVPNLIGKQLTDAKAIASADHFNVVQGEDTFSDIVPKGSIYQMSPAPGRSIKSGKDVTVSVSDGPRLVSVPDLSSMTLARATQLLATSALPEGKVTNQYSDTVSKGIVVTQQPAPGSNTPHDTPVDIVVSKGPAPPAAPSGLTATSSLDGEIDLTWNDDPDSVTYNIYRDGVKLQSDLPQAAYSDVNLGSGETHKYTVTGVNDNGESAQSAPATATTLVEGAPPTDSATVPPTDIGDNSTSGAPKQRRFDIKFKVPDTGTHNCQIEVQDTTGTNIVYDQDRSGGDTDDDNVIGFGNKIIFRIFIDGKLIRQDTK